MNVMDGLTCPDGGLRELALFAGAGGGILGGKLLGWRTVCAVEIEPYPASVLLARQNDGILPPFPVWDNVCTFDGRPWRGIVDVVSGGFPCQDISLAGKGAGITGERSGLWSEMARIIGEVRPRYVFVENSPALITRGLGTVLGDLAALGYDCRWTVLGAADVGAPHQRDRLWIVANASSKSLEKWEKRERFWYEFVGKGEVVSNCEHQGPRRRKQQPESREGARNVAYSDKHAWHAWRNGDADQRKGGRDADRGVECAHDVSNTNCIDADDGGHGTGQVCREREPTKLFGCESDGCNADSEGLEKWESQPGHNGQELAPVVGADWWESEPDVGRVVDGLAARVVRLKAIGNGQVPLVAAAAFTLLRG